MGKKFLSHLYFSGEINLLYDLNIKSKTFYPVFSVTLRETFVVTNSSNVKNLET